MYRINYDIIDTMLKTSENDAKKEILFEIKFLIDYAKHISTMEQRIRELIQKDDGMSNYAIRALETQRQEKHNLAIQSLYNLNETAVSMGLEKVYSGGFEETDRGDIAQAIFEFCKWYFKKY